MMNRKLIAMIITIIALLVAGCTAAPFGADDGSLNIVCTTFPAYDWLRNLTVGNEGVKLTLLVDGGVDLHSYQPTTDDVVKIASADLFVYGGGASDSWVEDALKEAVNDDMVVVNLMDALADRVQPMAHKSAADDVTHNHEQENEAAHSHEHRQGHQDDHANQAAHGHQFDEHIWLSPKNAEIIVKQLTNQLVASDSENALLYGQNSAHYLAELKQLDDAYQKAIGEAAHNTLVFADRFPFIYLCVDYGLEYYAAFSGCSAESEASFETIAFLADKLDALELGAVLVLEHSDGKIAQTVIDNSGRDDVKIIQLNSIQSLTAAEIKDDKGYLEMMYDNLSALQEALQ